MSEHDPRVDPQRGDVTRVEPWTFVVIAVAHQHVYVDRIHDTDDDEAASRRVCVSLDQWRDEMADATVEHTATPEVQP